MHLADYIRPLLRDHDCVIIPDFGGLVAESVPARLSAARQSLGPPAKQVAFNQALTRNDGLLVDALSQYLRIPAAQAREVLRHAVEDMHLDLRQSQRTELPGIGVFRQAPGRGLAFDYTGTDNLLPAAFGLPALSVRPVLATDARLAREKRPALLQQPAPRLRPAARRQFSRALKGVGLGLATTLLVGASYLLSLKAGLLPAAGPAPVSSAVPPPAAIAPLAAPAAVPQQPAPEPQQATLAHNDWSNANPDAADQEPTTTEARATDSALTTPPAPNRLLTKPAASAHAAPAATHAVLFKRATAATKAAASRQPLARAPRPAGPAAARKGAGRSVTKAKLPLAAQPAFAAVASAKPAVAAINRLLGRSYVIAGAFDSKAGAEACRRNLVRGGFANAKVLLPNRTTRRFRASAADYADAPSARQAAAQLRFKLHTFFDVYSY